MSTELGDKLARLRLSDIDKPALSGLVEELQGQCALREGFNDTYDSHTDYTNLDTGQYTDKVTKVKRPGKHPDHSDYQEGKSGFGWRHSHTDVHDMCDSHTDSGRYSDYTDMCR